MNRSAVHRPSEYESVESLPEMWTIAARRFANTTAVYDPHAKPEVKMTYAELYQKIQQFAAGLQSLGIQAETDAIPPRIALFADNSPRWIVADQGAMRSGAVDVVRGSQADPEELLFILKDSGAIALIVQDLDLLKKLRPCFNDLLPIQFVILLSDETISADETLKILNFSQVLELGAHQSLQPVHQSRQTLATLMYTSGTGGTPKGVMLTHGNLLSQVTGAYAVVEPQAGEKVLSILPIWHAYERAFEYFIFSNGCTQIYTTIRHVKKDLKDYQPHYMVGVPRLWESIYEGIQKQFREQPANQQKLVNFLLDASHRFVVARRTMKGMNLDRPNPSAIERLAATLQMSALSIVHLAGDKLVYQKVRAGTGGNLVFVVSGGGSIADHLEDFFEIVGIEILGGYGLTETSPITNARRPWRNIRGADGEPLPGAEIQIVDLETRKPLPAWQRGLVMIRGPQVMQGYYNNPVATANAIDADGWFDSGDLGMVTADNNLIITGRAKDTIVLTNGENIEPQPIEDACLRSPYIDQIMVVGQDQKVLGALIVPNLETLEKSAFAHSSPTLDLNSQPIQDLFRQELTRLVKERPGYRPDDRIGTFRLLPEPFTIENNLLTQTLKVRRNVVMDRYQGMINEMFD
jgi:long-chain acyl-CoA synthetase